MPVATVLSHKVIAADLGLLKQWLDENNFEIKRYFREDDWNPADLLAGDLLVILGSTNSVASGFEHESAQKEIDLVKARIEQNKKLFGICYGAQVIAKAVGGEVERARTVNRSYQNLSMAKSEISDGPWGFSHEDRIDPASLAAIPGVEILGEHGDATSAFTYSCAVAVQFHPEVDGAGYANMLSGVGVKEETFSPISNEMVSDDKNLRDRTNSLFNFVTS